MATVRECVEQVFRREHGRIIASLIRACGDFDLAEDALQDAFVQALDRWAESGVPDNPAAWLTTAARARAIDRLRRARVRAEKYALLGEQMAPDEAALAMLDQTTTSSLEDDRLRLIFTCCHPALNLDAQVALTLRTLGGLSTAEIARAFLVPEPTMGQRLVRAKQKIRAAGIPYQTPPDHLLAERLTAVLAVVYLIFNEGYAASAGDEVIRRDLCGEAIRLGRLLAALMPEEPEVLGLLALVLLHDARRSARVSASGLPVLLEAQDRAAWDQGAIEEGSGLVERALLLRRPGPYQVQAAIAALHAQAAAPERTDWPQIAALYSVLASFSPSPVVELNRAAAVAMAYGAEFGLALIDRPAVAGALEQYRWLHTTRGELLRRLARWDEAEAAYTRALQLSDNTAERSFVMQQLAAIRAATGQD
jgi:RNA polymerase sigma-70 factor (ECF subfamily)